MSSQLKKFKTSVKKNIGLKLSFQEEFGMLEAELKGLYKKCPPSATTRIEIKNNREENQREIKRFRSGYDSEVRALNEKYRKLDQDSIISGIRREIEIFKHANPDKFKIEVNQ